MRRYDNFKTSLEHFVKGDVPMSDLEFLYYEMKGQGLSEQYNELYDELFVIIETDAVYDKKQILNLCKTIINEEL